MKEIVSLAVDQASKSCSSWSSVSAVVNYSGDDVKHKGSVLTHLQHVLLQEEKLLETQAENFLLTLGMLSGVVSNGYKTRLVLLRKDAGVPLDLIGQMMVFTVEAMPVLYPSEQQLPLLLLDPKVVEVVNLNSISWKRIQKRGGFEALIAGASAPKLDLVEIANSGGLPPELIF